jgi:hypothetical protein
METARIAGMSGRPDSALSMSSPILPPVYDFLGPAVFDVAIVAYSRLVGEPLQRRRALRLAKGGKIRCVLFGADNPRVMPTRVLDGAAEVWERRIRLWSADLWVQDVELPPTAGPLEVFDEKGRLRRSDGDLLFRPRTRVFTLRTHQGRVKWAVLDWQADTALAMLGFSGEASHAP